MHWCPRTVSMLGYTASCASVPSMCPGDTSLQRGGTLARVSIGICFSCLAKRDTLLTDCANVLRASSHYCRPCLSFGYGTPPPPFPPLPPPPVPPLKKLVTSLWQACCLDDALVFPRGYLLAERKHVARDPIDFVPRVSSAMPKASMDVVFHVPRFHPRDACPLPVVSPCCESV
jgi:hypothetical protein